MDFKAAILKVKVAPAPAPAAAACSKPRYRIPSYFVEDEHRYRVYTAEEADYLDRCSPRDRDRAIALFKSGRLQLR